MVSRLHKQPEDFFPDALQMTREKFAKIEEWGKNFNIFGTRVWLQESLALASGEFRSHAPPGRFRRRKCQRLESCRAI